MNSKFKIGDRVKSPSGTVGTVIDVTHDGSRVVAEMDAGGVNVYRYPGKRVLWLPNEQYTLIPQNPNKIVITTDGKTTLARLYDGNKVVKSAEAKCSPDDTFDFAIGANLAYKRLMGAETKTEPKQDKQVREVKRAAKAGEYVKIVECKGAPEFVGTIGVVAGYRDGVPSVLHKTVWFDNGNGNEITRLSKTTEYVVLENYTPAEPAPAPERTYTMTQIRNALEKMVDDGANG